MASNEEGAVTSTQSETNIDDSEIFDSWTLISDKTIDRLDSVKEEIESILAEELGFGNQTESSETSGVEEVTDDQTTDTDCEQSDGISIISDSEFCPDRVTPSPIIQTLERQHSKNTLEVTSELSSFEYETPPSTSDEFEENLSNISELPKKSNESIFNSSNVVMLGVIFGIAGVAFASYFSTPVITKSYCPDLTHISPLVRRIHDVELENRELKRELNNLKTRPIPDPIDPVIQNKRTRVWTGDDNAETITIADRRFMLPDYCHQGKDELFDEYSTKNCLRMQKKIDERLKKNSFKNKNIKKENIKKVNIPIIDTSELSGVLNTNTGFVQLDSVFSDPLIKTATPNLFNDVFEIADKKNSTDVSEEEVHKKDNRYKGKRVRLEKYKKDDRRKSSYNKKKDDENYPQLNIREEISYSGDGQEKPYWSKSADNKRKAFKDNKNFEFKENDGKFKKNKNLQEKLKKFDENEKFIFKEKQNFDQKIDENSESDWHENLMKYREEMRNKNPESVSGGDFQNNWYLKRGSNRQKFRSNEGSGAKSTFR